MSIQEFTTVLRHFVSAPVIEVAPHFGAVITANGFTGTYAGSDCDSFGVEWHTVVSAFEQRHMPGDSFQWSYTWGSVQS